MNQVMINFRIDADLKKSMEKVCKDMGMSLTTAFTVFATKVAREKRIPFDVNVDPFYSKENIEFLKKAIAELDAGKGVEHELVGGELTCKKQQALQ